MVLNRRGLSGQAVLVAGATLSVGVFGLIPHDGLHPLALLASLLPLQLAALFWVFRAAGSRSPGSLPPANG